MKKHDLKTLWALFIIFFIQRDIVDKYKLLSNEDFLEYATLSQTLPGVIALNCASFVGRKVDGWIGMFAAGLGATISAFALMIVATILLQTVPQQGPVAGAFRGIRAASSAFILAAAFTLGRHNLKSSFSILLMLASFGLVFFAKVSAPIVIIAAGIAGYAFQRLQRKKEVTP
jgi:chromate transporter